MYVRWLIGSLLVALVASVPADALAGSPGPLFAAKASDKSKPAQGDEDTFEADIRHADDKIDVFKGVIDLTVWSIVVFLILLAILGKFAWPQIREGLDKREQTIAHDKHEADRAKREAGEVKTRLEAEIARVNDQIRQMMDKARLDAIALAAEEQSRGKAELQTERERQHRELRTSTEEAYTKIWNDVAQVATTISAKAIRKELSVEDHRTLVREALDEFQAAGAGRLDDLKSARA